MKVLKKQGLTLFLIAALIVTMTLGIIFMMPARTANAEEEFKPDVTVQSARALKEAVQNASSSENTPYKIQLGADILIGGADDLDNDGLRTGARNLIIDLNGHTMKRQDGWWVISVNSPDGKLELIDTSEGKTGAITNDIFSDTLIYNYGTLITNVNITGGTYHDPIYGGSNSFAVIKSSPNPKKDDLADGSFAEKWSRKPSFTIKGGEIRGGNDYELINIVDSSLTIENGKFIRDGKPTVVGNGIFKAESFAWVSNTNSENKYIQDSNTEALEEALTDLKPYMDAYKPYRGNIVRVTGGDFTGSEVNGDRIETILVNDKIPFAIPSQTYGNKQFNSDETYKNDIALEGGMWGLDLSTYCPEGKWMRLVDFNQDIGPEGTYYVVDDVDWDAVVASVIIDGVPDRIFSNFDAAWLYATRDLDGARTVKAEQDAAIDQLNLQYGNGDTDALPGEVTLDLNGHKLTYSDLSPAINGSHAAITLGNDGNLGEGKEFKLIMKDSTPEQKGELLIKIESSSPSDEHGIHISNQYAKFELQSGTIRQTGYFPNEKTYTDPEGGNGSQNQAEAIFNISKSLKDVSGAIVTIKGGNILSEIYFGTEESHGALTSSPIFIAWGDGRGRKEDGNVNFQDGAASGFPNKDQKFVFDLDNFIKVQRKTSVFSWDLKSTSNQYWGNISETFADFTYVTLGTSRFALTHLEDTDNFLVGSTRYAELDAAISAAKAADGVVSLLRPLTLKTALKLENVTLDLDAYLGYHITFGEGGSLTLGEGATLSNGTVEGNITVEGDATLQGVTVTGDVTVKSGTLTIPSGTYQGTFTFQNGANAVISGGSFKGSQIATLDQYFTTAHGAYIAAGQEYSANDMYEVKIAPNLAAQGWYKECIKAGKFEIASTDDWNAFALYVSSGADDFYQKTVTLTQDLDFGYKPSVNGVAAAAEPETFYPAGNQKYKFVGNFDGGNNTIKGIYVTEINAGLFGGTNGPARIDHLTVADSLFIGGKDVGYFDEFNTEKGWVFVGGVVAQGNLGHTGKEVAATGIKVKNVTLSQKEPGTIMGGGFIGQTWSTLYLEGIEVDDVTLDGGWKMGGVVGFTEASVYIIDGSVKNVESARDCTYFGSVMGQLVGQALSLDGCNVNASDSYLVGGMDAGSEKKDVSIKGTGTAIAAKGITGTTGTSHGPHEVDLKVNVPTTEEETKGGFVLDFKEEEIPGDAFKTEAGDPVVVMVYSKDGNIVRFAKLAEALQGANDGDTVVLNGDVGEEKVTFNTGKEVTLDLGGHTLTGTITVGSGKLTLENGNITAESGDTVTVNDGGTLVLTVPAVGEGETIKELKITAKGGKAVNGKYSVEKNRTDVCVRESDNEIYLAKEHEVGSYTVAGDTITVHCVYDNVGYGRVTVVAPENPTYGDEKIEATVGIIGFEPDETPTITYKNEAGEPVDIITEAGTYTASIVFHELTASVTFTVKPMELVISNIQGTVGYQGEGQPTLAVSSYVLKDLAGNVVEDHTGITVTVTLQRSNYGVGKQIALITAIDMTGNGNYTLATAGNEAFLELEVIPAALTVRVDKNGKVVYEGFVNGEDESVLEGELHLERVDNGDGTSTVTPSGLTSANYVITFESGIVENEQSNNALWITLAVVGGVIAALGAVAVVYTVRRKKN